MPPQSGRKDGPWLQPPTVTFPPPFPLPPTPSPNHVRTRLPQLSSTLRAAAPAPLAPLPERLTFFSLPPAPSAVAVCTRRSSHCRLLPSPFPPLQPTPSRFNHVDVRQGGRGRHRHHPHARTCPLLRPLARFICPAGRRWGGGIGPLGRRHCLGVAPAPPPRLLELTRLPSSCRLPMSSPRPTLDTPVRPSPFSVLGQPDVQQRASKRGRGGRLFNRQRAAATPAAASHLHVWSASRGPDRPPCFCVVAPPPPLCPSRTERGKLTWNRACFFARARRCSHGHGCVSPPSLPASPAGPASRRWLTEPSLTLASSSSPLPSSSRRRSRSLVQVSVASRSRVQTTLGRPADAAAPSPFFQVPERQPQELALVQPRPIRPLERSRVRSFPPARLPPCCLARR